jgi:hypothetical protein
MCIKLAHEDDNMERFIIGCQFLVVLVVFVTNISASAMTDAKVFGLPSIVKEIILLHLLIMSPKVSMVIYAFYHSTKHESTSGLTENKK